MDPTTIAQLLASSAQMPARPVTPTPPTAQDLSAYLYGPPPTPQSDPLGNLQGPRPQQDLPTHMQPVDAQGNLRYPLLSARAGPPPLPSYLPQNVQNYIRTQPSYEEGQRQTYMPPSITRGGEPYDQTPQIGDINRLFAGRITQNAPSSAQSTLNADVFRQLMQMPGFSGFTGGDNI